MQSSRTPQLRSTYVERIARRRQCSVGRAAPILASPIEPRVVAADRVGQVSPPRAPTGGLFGFAVGTERLQESHDIVEVGLLGQARKGHLGAGDLGLGVLEVVLQRGLVPGQA